MFSTDGNISSRNARNEAMLFISFGGDGNSCELKAMLVHSQLLTSFKNPLMSLSPSYNLPILKKIPLEWQFWFAVSKPNSFGYVQDTVHIAVNLKSRLLQPPIVLPTEKYLAGLHHLRLVQ